jgi:hypothetical protein
MAEFNSKSGLPDLPEFPEKFRILAVFPGFFRVPVFFRILTFFRIFPDFMQQKK